MLASVNGREKQVSWGPVSTEGRDSTGKQAGGTREKGGRMDRDPFAQPLEFRLEAKVLAKGSAGPWLSLPHHLENGSLPVSLCDLFLWAFPCEQGSELGSRMFP